jgi:hypothetical protein
MPPRHNQQDHRSMPPPSSMPLDPTLAIYSSYYPYQQSQHISAPHLTLPNASSPSSQGSDALGTPPVDQMYHPSNGHGKRRSSSTFGANGGHSRKKARKDDDDDDDDSQSPAAEKDEVKTKSTRGSRYAMDDLRWLLVDLSNYAELAWFAVVSRWNVLVRNRVRPASGVRLETMNVSLKNQIGGNAPPSVYLTYSSWLKGWHSDTRKHELLTRSLRKMERTLDTVLKSIGNPDIASGYVSRSPTPDAQTATTQALIGSPSPPPSISATSHHLQVQQQQHQQLPKQHPPPGSPKLHSLPDNSLNPLGLLAEASLANRRANASSFYTNQSVDLPPPDGEKKLGVASDLYFKPGLFELFQYISGA